MRSQKFGEKAGGQRETPGNSLVKLFKQLLALYIRGVYIEYPVLNDDGKVIGYEFCSPHSDAIGRVMNE